MFLLDKSILEWIVIVCAGLFIILAVFTYSFPLFAKEQFHLDITFPRDMDLEEKFHDIILPADEHEEIEFIPHPDAVKTLDVKKHSVKKGQTISEIALSFRLNVDTIISYNDIKSVRKIYPGMNLLIPNTDGIKYYVRKGDCLSCIAQKFRISLNNLLDWNNISSSIINPGLVLFIPGVKMNKFELAKVLGTLFIYPTSGGLTSKYGWRNHPISKKRHFHNGIDISNSSGTTIRASMDGKVKKIGYNHIYGKFIIIQHENGYQTFYGHLKKATVKQGKTVFQGNKIGEMGNTGYSTGNHLHFSIYKNGETVDPLLYVKK